jgi:hypothetical protein
VVSSPLRSYSQAQAQRWYSEAEAAQWTQEAEAVYRTLVPTPPDMHAALLDMHAAQERLSLLCMSPQPTLSLANVAVSQAHAVSPQVKSLSLSLLSLSLVLSLSLSHTQTQFVHNSYTHKQLYVLGHIMAVDFS